jgi:uncharacterized protein (DUF4415 family)
MPVSIVHTESEMEIHIIHSGERQKERPSIFMKTSKVNRKGVQASKVSRIRLTPEHPEMDPKHIVRSIIRNGMKPVAPKTAISLRIDSDVLEWFKKQGSGYQTRMSTVLKVFKEASGG